MSRLIACALSVIVLATACGGAATVPPPAAAPAVAPTAAVAPLVKVGTTPLGQILVDAKGMTLYTWVKDTDENSQCYDACATAWPPLVSGTVTVTGEGVKGKLATSTRKDGKLNVTYNGKPLYYFRSDVAAGDTKGQGSNGFGAPWLVVLNP